MPDHEPGLAELTRKGSALEAQLTRRLGKPPAAVWQMLIDPSKLAQWVAPGRIEPRVDGKVLFDFADSGTVIDSKVTEFEDGRLVAFSWSAPGEPTRPVRWEVSPEAAGARLRLTLHVPSSDDAARTCAGWEAHLEMLEAALAGVPIKFPFESFQAVREAYKIKVAAL